jgi:ketosteroid isomerase-like protein
VKYVLCLAIISAACLAGAQISQDVKNKDVPPFLRQLADNRKTIADGYVRWTEAARAKNVDAIVSMYTDDATVLPEEKEAVSEKNAVRAFYGEWFAQQDKLIEEKFENINSVQEGDLLIDSTRYSGILMKDGKEVRFSGKRLVVWKREFQGPWKILRDTWNKSAAQ